jgi:heparin binding hemagglutinin HbhA
MAKAKFDIKSEATRGLYAGAGVADVAVEYVRETVADVQSRFASYQKDAKAKVSGVQKQVSDFEFDAVIAELQAEAKALPNRVQSLVDENVATINDTYADLAQRGEVLVARIRKQEATKATARSVKTTSAKAKATRTSATKTAKSTTTSAKTSAKKTADTAKTSATQTADTAKKGASTTKSTAKATSTAAQKTAEHAVDAATDASEKVGD